MTKAISNKPIFLVTFLAFLSVAASEEKATILKSAPLETHADKSRQMVIQSEKQREEIEKIQTELKDIISRTSQLQNQVKGSRNEIQRILQRAQIHERILKNMSVPQTIQMKSQINTEEIVKREKLRLIAEQTRQTQEQLRTIQQTQSLKTMQVTPTNKTSQTS